MDITIRFNEQHPKYKQLIQLLADEGHTVHEEVRPRPEPTPTPVPEPTPMPFDPTPEQQQTTVDIVQQAQDKIDNHLNRPKTIDDIKELVMQLVPAKRIAIAKELLDRLGVTKLSEIPADKLEYAYNHFHKFFEV